jgi:hypothetical protein
MLPDRYNQLVIDNFFKLTHEADRANEGIDFQSFIYYDFGLRLFYNTNATRKWSLNLGEFTKVLSNQLFPQEIFKELTLIPSTNFTSVSFNLFLINFIG